MSKHVVLLGDSIFDNALYVPGGPSLLEHVRRVLPRDWRVTLLAVDGAVVSSVFQQLNRIPDDATHLVLSVGGNDALMAAEGLFASQAESAQQVLAQIAALRREFAAEYRELVHELRQFRKPLAICTVYDAIPDLGDAARAGLCIFNDEITRAAFSAGATLLDLRTICDEPTDYSAISPIEPSAAGGGKIARAIAAAVLGGEASARVIASS